MALKQNPVGGWYDDGQTGGQAPQGGQQQAPGGGGGYTQPAQSYPSLPAPTSAPQPAAPPGYAAQTPVGWSTGGPQTGGYETGDTIVNSYGGGGGSVNLSRGAYESQQSTAQRAQLAKEAQERAMAGFTSATGLLPGGASGGGPSDEALRQAEALAYGKAKDKIGANRLGAVKSFRDAMAGRGLMSSTIESAGLGDIISGGSSDLGDFALQQAEDEIGRARFESDRTVDIGERRRSDMLRTLASVFGSGGSLY